jgi:hypothetical protein
MTMNKNGGREARRKRLSFVLRLRWVNVKVHDTL